MSYDDETVGFQWLKKERQRINYKKEGDGFLTDFS